MKGLKLKLNLLIIVSWVIFSQVAFSLTSYSGDGENTDFGIEIRDEMVYLYLAKIPTNEPIKDAIVKFVPDDEKISPIEFKPSNEPGVYTFDWENEKIPDGQIVVEGEHADEVDVYLNESDDGHDHGHDHHDHAHGRTAGKDFPAWMLHLMFLFGGIILGGVIIRILSGRKTVITTASSIIVFGIMSSVISQEAFAGEGHSHGEAKISDAPIGSEVTVSKRSQFMIGLRTIAATKKQHNRSIEAFGHLVAKPDLNAVVTAPRSGFLKGKFDRIWGQKVKKGQILAKIDSVGAINVRAPIEGTVLEVSAVSGMRVEQGTVLFKIVDLRNLWIDAELFQEHIALVSKKAGTAKVSVDGIEGSFTARITGAFSGVSENTLTAKVFLELDNTDEEFQLGNSVTVSMPLQEDKVSGFLVPRRAILNRGGDKLVFVQTGAETFETRAVQTLKGTTPDSLVIIKGIEENDRIVTIGNYQLLVGAH